MSNGSAVDLPFHSNIDSELTRMTQNDEKRLVAEASLDHVESGMTVGLGSGSTAEWMIRLLGERISSTFQVHGVPTSRKSEQLARECGIPLRSLNEVDRVDLTIDGADEVDRDRHLIKGGGGALLREKVVASASDRLLIIVDRSKLVDRLGAFPLPVEITPFAEAFIARKITALGGTPRLRMQDHDPFATDGGHHILDCAFDAIDDPTALAHELDRLPGVMEQGLFIGLASLVLVGDDGGVETL